MATPLGHYLVGLSITHMCGRDPRERTRGFWLAALACAPDLDAVPGLLTGTAGEFHRGPSHSFVGAAIVSVAVWLFLRGRVAPGGVRGLTLLFLVYGSHLILDSFTLDTGEPYGVPFFWPLVHETYQASWVLLPNVQHTRAPLLSLHNVLVMLRECFLFFPLIGLVHHLRLSGSDRLTWVYGGWLVAAIWTSATWLN